MLFANRAPPQLILSHRCGRTCFFRTRIFCFLLPQSGFLLFPSSSSFPLLRRHPFHWGSFVSVSFSNRSMQRWEGEVQERESGCGGAGTGWLVSALPGRSVHFKSFRRVSCSQLTSPRARGHSAGTGRCFSYVPALMDGSHCLFFSVKKDSENNSFFFFDSRFNYQIWVQFWLLLRSCLWHILAIQRVITQMNLYWVLLSSPSLTICIYRTNP